MKTIPNLLSKKLLLIGLLILNTTLYAEPKEDNRPPQGCRDVGYEFNLNSLHFLSANAGLTQSMYFLYNTSNQKIILFQMRGEESSRSMYLNHEIGAGQWAVLSTTDKKMKFICATPQANLRYGKIVHCSDNLRVCEYTNVKYGMNNRGNFWLVNSTTKNGAIREVVRYGIIPAV